MEIERLETGEYKIGEGVARWARETVPQNKSRMIERSICNFKMRGLIKIGAEW